MLLLTVMFSFNIENNTCSSFHGETTRRNSEIEIDFTQHKIPLTYNRFIKTATQPLNLT